MAAARLLTWGLLLAAAGRPGARGSLPAGLAPGGTLQRGGDPLHGPPWEASGEQSGTGAPEDERWGGGSPVRWSPPLRVGGATGAPRGTETAAAATGAVVEEPVVAGRAHEAEDRDSPRGGPWLPRGSALGTPGPGVLADTWPGSPGPDSPGPGSPGPGSPGPPRAGQGTPGPASPPGPRPAVSATAPTPVPAAGTGAADTHAGGPTAAPGLPRDAELALGGGQPVPLGTSPVSSPPGTGWGPPGGGVAEPWTRAPPAHQRSTRRAPLGTASPGDAAPGPSGQREPRPGPGGGPTSSTAPPGTELLPGEAVGSPQRVRGAVGLVGPVDPPNATQAAPRPTAHPATGTPGTNRSDAPGTPPPAQGSAAPSAPWRQAGGTRQPGPPPTPPAAGANGTGRRWAELRRRWGFAWDTHVYGGAAAFLLLALGCLGGLAGAAALRPPHLPHVLGAHGLLLAACLLRATFLLLDPFGARGRLPPRALLLLAAAPFPLLLAAFALLLQRLQRLARLRLLPAGLRGLPALGAAAALHGAVLAAADLLPPRLAPAAAPGLHALGCAAAALLLLGGGVWGCWRVLRAPGGGGGPGARRGARALLAAAAAGLPVCGLQLYGALWLRAGLAPPGRLSRPGWAAQLWLRLGELATALALLAAAAEPPRCRGRCRGRRRRGPAGHSCWAKALRFFCAGRPEAPEPRGERPPAPAAPQSLLRGPAEPSPGAPAAASAGPGSSPSLGELGFRPPSPIDLRRSIDRALCRRHLLRDGLFGRPRRGSGASLHGPPGPPAPPGPRRLARCSSLTALPGPAAPARPPPGSLGSLGSASLGSAWDPWHRGPGSPDSLPLDGTPSRAPLLVPDGRPPGARPRASPALGGAADARSLSSDTIEL